MAPYCTELIMLIKSLVICRIFHHNHQNECASTFTAVFSAVGRMSPHHKHRGKSQGHTFLLTTIAIWAELNWHSQIINFRTIVPRFSCLNFSTTTTTEKRPDTKQVNRWKQLFYHAWNRTNICNRTVFYLYLILFFEMLLSSVSVWTNMVLLRCCLCKLNKKKKS